MKINYITFMIRDIEKTISFYTEAADLKIQRRFNPGPGEIVFMADKEGDTILEFIEFPDAEKYEGKGLTVIFGHEGSLEELRNKIIEMGYEASEMFTGGPGPDNFKVKDPDGIMVEFINA